jgi:hypothetical protein
VRPEDFRQGDVLRLPANMLAHRGQDVLAGAVFRLQLDPGVGAGLAFRKSKDAHFRIEGARCTALPRAEPYLPRRVVKRLSQALAAQRLAGGLIPTSPTRRDFCDFRGG